MSSRIVYILIFLSIALLCGCRKNISNTGSNFKVIDTKSSFVGLKTIQLTNGNYVVTMDDINNRNICFLIAVNETGKEIWRKYLGDSLNLITDIQPLPNGNFAISSIDDSDQLELDICVLSSSGEFLWKDYYHPDKDSFLIQSAKLGITRNNTINLITTLSHDYYKKPNKIINLQYNLNGNFIGNYTYSTDTINIYTAFQLVTLNDHIDLTGIFRNHTKDTGFRLTDFNFGSFLMSFNDAGQENLLQKQGFKTIGQNNIFYFGQSLCLDKYQNIIQAGILSTIDKNYNLPRAYDFSTLQSGYFYWGTTGDVMVVKVNEATGDTINYNTFSLLNLTQRVEINTTNDNGCILIATDNKYLYNSYNASKATLIKLDQNLNLQWQSTINTPYPVAPFSVFQTSNGGYLVFSMIQSFNKEQQLAIFKTDAQGNL